MTRKEIIKVVETLGWCVNTTVSDPEDFILVVEKISKYSGESEDRLKKIYYDEIRKK